MELSKSIFAFKTNHSCDMCPGDSGHPMMVFNGFQYDEMPVTNIISKDTYKYTFLEIYILLKRHNLYKT